MFESNKRSESHEDPVVIGLFSYASDARRTVLALHERQFSTEQVGAAFREPAAARSEIGDTSSSGGDSSAWFGRLRQIYRGSESAPIRGEAAALPGSGGQVGFEAMLQGIQLSEEDAAMLNRDLDRGAALVTVRAGARNQEAQALLEKRGARILHTQAHAARAVPEAPAQPTMIHSTPFAPPPPASPDHIQLFGEALRVRKEKVNSGEVHVRKESVTRMETIQVPVTREHLVVEHTDGSGPEAAEHTLRIPLNEERVHIDKDTVLRAEYKVGKQEITQNESVSDTVRRERLLIDDAAADAKG